MINAFLFAAQFEFSIILATVTAPPGRFGNLVTPLPWATGFLHIFPKLHHAAIHHHSNINHTAHNPHAIQVLDQAPVLALPSALCTVFNLTYPRGG